MKAVGVVFPWHVVIIWRLLHAAAFTPLRRNHSLIPASTTMLSDCAGSMLPAGAALLLLIPWDHCRMS